MANGNDRQTGTETHATDDPMTSAHHRLTGYPREQNVPGPTPRKLDKRFPSNGSVERVGPLLAQGGPGITPPAVAAAGLSHDDQAVVDAGRMILTTPALRHLAEGLSLELLVGWISAESSGNYRELSVAGEAGYFQVDAETITHVLQTTAQAVIATPQSSLDAGLRMVRICDAQVRRWTATFATPPADGDTRWRLVKLYHTIGPGAFRALLRAAAPNVPRPLRWRDLTVYWQNNAGTIGGTTAVGNKLRQYDRMTRNVERVMAAGARLAPRVSAATPQPAPP